VRGSNATIESIHIQRMEKRTRKYAQSECAPERALRSALQLSLDEVHQTLDGEELRELRDLRIALEIAEVDVRHALLEERETLGADLAVLDQARVGHQVLGEELALLDLEWLLRRRELLLEAEHDVEIVNRLRAEIAGEGGVERHFLGIDAQGVLEYFGHVGDD